MRKIILLLITAVLSLTAIGIVMLGSASVAIAESHGKAPLFYVMRQLLWLGISVMAAIGVSRLDYHKYVRLALVVGTVAMLLLLLVWSPIGKYVNGSYRWIVLGKFITLQPSEFAKPAVVILFSWWLMRHQRRIEELKYGIVVPFGLLACFALPIIMEPDFGTTMQIASVCIFMMFIGGVPVGPLVIATCAGLMAVAVMLLENPERMARIMAFLNPQKYAQDKAWQLINSLRAFASGGWSGVGFGNSIQKYYYLPEAHTDFIFPIIGEELGLIGDIIVLLFFLLLFLCGLFIALRARDDFGRFMAFGMIMMITMQALINFAVVTGCVPTKGLALPFISYGGSSLLSSSLMIGILINIAKTNMKPLTAASRNPFKDRAHSV